MSKKRGIRVWLSRDESQSAPYEMWRNKPDDDDGVFWDDMHSRLGEYRRFDFERVTGYKLKPGKCKRVRISVEEV